MRKNYWKRLKKRTYAIDSLQILRKYLTAKQRVVLALFVEGHGISELAGKTKLTREEVLYQLLHIGRALAYYELLECSILPEPQENTSVYLEGWNDFRKKILEEVKNGKLKEINKKTI